MNSEESAVVHFEAILAEQEAIRSFFLVMGLSSVVEDEVFNSKVLDDLLALLMLHIDRFLRVNYAKDAMVLLWNDECRDTLDAEVEVINDIALRVEEHLSGEELRLEAGTDPSDEMLLTKLVPEGELLKILPVDFLTDFEFEMHWEHLDEGLQALEVRLVIVSESFLNLKVELV